MGRERRRDDLTGAAFIRRSRYMTFSRPSSCERARFLAALAPDATLSQLEERLLARHLARCPGCSSFAASVAAFTHEFRMAPLVEQDTRVHTGFAGRRWSSRWSLKVPLAALTSAAAAVLMTTMITQEKSRTVLPSLPPVIAAGVAPVDNEVEVIHEFRYLSLVRSSDHDIPAGQPGMYLG